MHRSTFYLCFITVVALTVIYIDPKRKRIKLGWFIDFSVDKKKTKRKKERAAKHQTNGISHLRNKQSAISVEQRVVTKKQKPTILEHFNLINF